MNSIESNLIHGVDLFIKPMNVTKKWFDKDQMTSSFNTCFCFVISFQWIDCTEGFYIQCDRIVVYPHFYTQCQGQPKTAKN